MLPQQNYYTTPSLSTIVAYVCAALMIFFVVILCLLYQDTEKLQKETERLGARLSKLEDQNGKLASLPQTPVQKFVLPNMTDVKTPAAVKSEVIVPERSLAVSPVVNKNVPKIKVKPVLHFTAQKKEADKPEEISTLRAPDPRKIMPDSQSVIKVKKSATSNIKAAGIKVKKSVSEKDTPLVSASIVKDEVSSPAKIVTGTSGKILATNQGQMRVILSCGSTTGIQIGNRFNVYRNDRWVGEIVVAKVFSDMSMCSIKSSPRGIRVEDIAKAATGSTR